MDIQSHTKNVFEIKGKLIHGVNIVGTDVDTETRCAHYHTERDIIAVKFKCCGQWFPCFECHAAHADHQPAVWSKNEFDEPAILCGGCGHQLTVNEYLQSEAVCPQCRRQFNPNCDRHYHLYFDVAS